MFQFYFTPTHHYFTNGKKITITTRYDIFCEKIINFKDNINNITVVYFFKYNLLLLFINQ